MSDAATWVKFNDLVEWDKNPRHNSDAAWMVARSIEEIGWGAPVVAQASSMRLIAGHARLKAARILAHHTWNPETREWEDRVGPWQLDGAPGPNMIPARLLSVSDKQANQLAIADNKLNEVAEWDQDALEALVADLAVGEDDMIDYSAVDWLGFETEALQALLESEDSTPEPSKPGPAKDEAKEKTPVQEHEREVSFRRAKISVTVAIEESAEVANLIRDALEQEEITFALDVE